MTPEEFRATAEALFGPDYIAEMARALGNHPRRLRRMREGRLPIPPGLAEELRRMLAAKTHERDKCRPDGDKPSCL
jgi:hypothetical protein